MAIKQTSDSLKPTPSFELSLSIGNETYIGDGNNFTEAIRSIYKDSFGMIKIWGTFTLMTGGKSSTVRYRPIQIKRAFLGRFAQNLLEKRLRMSLK